MTSAFRITLVAAAALTATLPSVLAAQDGPRRDGRWQVRMEMSMPGAPTNLPPMTIEQCVSKQEAENPELLMPSGPGAAQGDCKITDRKVSGNTVTWSMKCQTPEPMTGTGEFTYRADTYEGIVTMNRAGQTMTMKYTAKRLGDCVK